MSLFRKREPLPGERGFEREAAKELIRSAKNYVKEGKEIYNSAQTEAYGARNDADRAVGAYKTFCEDTLKTLNSNLRPVISKFKDVGVGGLSAPKMTSISSLTIPQMSVSGFVEFPNPLSDFFDWFLDEYQYEKAKEQCARARAYRDEMRLARQEFRNYRDSMYRLCDFLEQDKKQIAELTTKVSAITDQLQVAMASKNHTIEEERYFESVCQIADSICTHLTTTYLQDNGCIDEKFRKQSFKLSELNKSISSAPQISDQTILNVLRTVGADSIET